MKEILADIWEFISRNRSDGEGRCLDFTNKRDQIKILFLSLGMILFVSAVGYFVWIVPIVRTTDTKNWAQTEATITFMGFKDNGDELRFDVRYAYNFGDRKFEATRYAYADKWESCPLLLGIGSKIDCFVNPANPSQSIVARTYPTSLKLWSLLPFVLLTFSLAAFVKVLWYIAFHEQAVTKTRNTVGLAPSDRVKTSIAGLLFLGLGVFFAYLVIVRPLNTAYQIRQWQPASCDVQSMSINDNKNGTSWNTHVDVLYHYEFENDKYQSTVYQPEHTITASDDDAVEVLAPGNQTTCYVNPRNPAEAVMVKPRIPAIWFLFASIPLIFVAIGIGIIWYIIRQTVAARKQATGPSLK